MTTLFSHFIKTAPKEDQAILQRFAEDMLLGGYSERSIEMYVRAVRQLSAYYKKCPESVTDEEMRKYFLYNSTERGWSRTASTIALCGIKLFSTLTLKRDWTNLKFIRPKKEKKLPVILSIEEIHKILANVKMPYHRVCLATIYSLGLRLQEGRNLKTSDIHSDRMFVHIRKGKGNKDRYIPLPKRTLHLLRDFWKTHRNPVWIFPQPGRGHISMPTAKYPMPISSIQIAFKEARIKAGIQKNVSVHHLRHSYATHLLEAGVNFRLVQEYLGHNDPKTTLVYTRLIKLDLKEPTNIINGLMEDLL